MKITTNENGGVVIREIYSGVIMETKEGNQIAVCMRDDTFEINVCPKGKNIRNWWRVNMDTDEITPI